MSKAKDFLDAVRSYTQQPAGTRVPAQDRPPKMGTVDPSYSGNGPAKVKFDGEAAVSAKAYVCVNCAPLPGDRVVLVPVGKTLAIIGTIGATSVGAYGPFEDVSVAFASAPNSFPQGLSIGIVNGDAGWPTNFATIITHYESTARATQTVYSKTEGRTYVRTVSSTSNVWAPFNELHSDSTPQTPFAMAAGRGTTGSSIASLGNLNVSPTFPVGRFTQAPLVVATSGNARLTTGISAVTTSGFTLSLSNWSNATASTGQEYDWIAIQMLPGAAPG